MTVATRLLSRAMRGTLDAQKATRRSQFDELRPPADHVLFLGDSITEGGEWAEWFPRLPTLNRGIGGDTVAGVAARLDSAVNAPRAISLLIGTNDLSGIGASTRPRDVADQAHALIRSLKERAAGTPVVLNSITPRSRAFADAVGELNAHYREIAEVEAIPYVDVWALLVGSDHAIRPEFSNDKLHLTGAGYRTWVPALSEALASAGVA